jgi:hypothetical protein
LASQDDSAARRRTCAIATTSGVRAHCGAALVLWPTTDTVPGAGVSRSLKDTGTANVGTQKVSKKSDSRRFKHSLTLGLLGRDLRPGSRTTHRKASSEPISHCRLSPIPRTALTLQLCEPNYIFISAVSYHEHRSGAKFSRIQRAVLSPHRREHEV